MQFPNVFTRFDEEDFIYDITNGSSAVINNNALKFNHRSALEKALLNNKSLHTFNIQPNVDLDPFKTIRFHNVESSQFYRTLFCYV